MIEAELVGGGSTKVKEQSWLLRGVNNAGYVTTDQAQYLHLSDLQVSENRWKELLQLLRLPLSTVVIDEDGGSVYLDLHKLTLHPGSFGIRCILRAKGALSTYLICYLDGHVEICSENHGDIMNIKRVAMKLSLLSMN